MKQKIILIFISIFISSILLARKPAVIPVTGLSIDDYQVTKVDKGFNWSKNTTNQANTKQPFPYWLGLLLLPIASLYLIKKRSESNFDYQNEQSQVSSKSNITGQEKVHDSHNDDNDQDFPMAS